MREAAGLADRGLLTPRLDAHSYPLAMTNDAYDAIEAGRSDGKVVIDLDRN